MCVCGFVLVVVFYGCIFEVLYLSLRIVPPAFLVEGRGGREGKLNLSKIRVVDTIRLKTKLIL